MEIKGRDGKVDRMGGRGVRERGRERRGLKFTTEPPPLRISGYATAPRYALPLATVGYRPGKLLRRKEGVG